jgi:hypothetical protein
LLSWINVGAVHEPPLLAKVNAEFSEEESAADIKAARPISEAGMAKGIVSKSARKRSVAVRAVHELPFLPQQLPLQPTRRSRRSIRLKEYDYSQPGGYYLTLVTFQRENLFGRIANGDMYLTEAGRIVRDVWEKLPGRYPNVVLDEMVIMPNHFHGIVFITDEAAVAGVAGVAEIHELPLPPPQKPWYVPIFGS